MESEPVEVLRSSSTISEPEAVGQALQAASLVTTPPLAENSKQFEAARKGLEDAAVASGGLWVSYLFVAFYLAIAAGAVTHLDLFLENPVRLPFLNIELPLLAFFSLAPILFLIIHVYALAHFVILSERANNYNAALRALLGVAQDHASEALAAGDAMRRQLPSNVIVQFLAGPQYSRNGAFGLLLGAIAWITLVVAPIGLFLLLQVQFLPFHDALITWVQRGALAFDVLLSIWLWRKILSARERASPQRSWVSRLATAFAIVAIIAAIAIAVLSCTLVTFPGEWQETALPSLEIFPALHGDSTDGGEVERVSLHEWLFNSPVDKFTRRRKLPLSSTLVLTAANVYEGMKVDDPKKTEWRKFVFSARGRNLNGAVFELASLPKVDFAGAQLQGVSFNEAQLQGSSFDAAQLQDSSFRFASLEGTSFESADLEYADFSFAVLPGASLILAQLQGADLEYASLQGANLSYAQLTGASLEGASLQGASFGLTNLDGASLRLASLEGAALAYASLQGADVAGARIQGAIFYHADLRGASLQNAAIGATDFTGAYLWRTNRLPDSATKAVSPSSVLAPDAKWERDLSPSDSDVRPWTDQSYAQLAVLIDGMTPGEMHDAAVKRIRVLDCANPDKTLASCDPRNPFPIEADDWRRTLEASRTSDASYQGALVGIMKEIVCDGRQNSIQVVRGLLQKRISVFSEKVGRTLYGEYIPFDRYELLRDHAFVDFIMSDKCPVHAVLTEDDRAALSGLK